MIGYRAALQMRLLLALVVVHLCLDTSPATWLVWVLVMPHSTATAMVTGTLYRSCGLRLLWFPVFGRLAGPPAATLAVTIGQSAARWFQLVTSSPRS